MPRYVAYFRVSTEKQGRSGLGLAAQRSVIERFLTKQDELVAEFIEVQSGKDDDRAELWKAIAHAKRNDAKILIAKLDRFSRKVSFIAGIMEQGIGLSANRQTGRGLVPTFGPHRRKELIKIWGFSSHLPTPWMEFLYSRAIVFSFPTVLRDRVMTLSN